MALGVGLREAFGWVEAAWHGHIADTPPLVPVAPDLPASEFDEAPEVAGLRDALSARVIEEAIARARVVGVGAERVLVHGGFMTEEQVLRLSAAHWHLPFESLDNVRREACPLSDERLVEAVAGGIVPLRMGDEIVMVVAPRGFALRRLTEMVRHNPAFAKRFRLTTPERLHRFVAGPSGQIIGQRASNALQRRWPELSAAPPRWHYPLAPTVLAGLIVGTAFVVAPGTAALVFEFMLALVFVSWMALRVAGTMVRRLRHASPVRIPDSELPVYSILVALYRESASVAGLVAALNALDYPSEKLDVKLVVEADDAETREALAQLQLRPPFEIVVSPVIGPRTKPKALNVALPFARGTFTVIYDAEDRPERDQLRRALDAFVAHDDKLACVQACLTIDNTADNWLTALFTAEYAGQFDVFLPALAALKMPLPLGGSSNHFRTSSLRAVGGWDPYNVTEDADLGMRLARFGLGASVIEATTYEEAPARFPAWLRQRTRWFKGWMQTWLVHMRQPSALLRDLGLPAFLTFQLMVGGNVLAALVHPLFLAWFASELIGDEPFLQTQGTAALFGFTVLFGYATSALIAGIGLFRRGLAATSWALLLMPVHWLLLSLAAWRAAYQLIREPYRWEKTEHGLARTSRSVPDSSKRQLLALLDIATEALQAR